MTGSSYITSLLWYRGPTADTGHGKCVGFVHVPDSEAQYGPSWVILAPLSAQINAFVSTGWRACAVVRKRWD